MIVPSSQLPSSGASGPLAQTDPSQKPSPALLLMAAAEMHKMGRLHGHSARTKGKVMATPTDDGSETA